MWFLFFDGAELVNFTFPLSFKTEFEGKARERDRQVRQRRGCRRPRLGMLLLPDPRQTRPRAFLSCLQQNATLAMLNQARKELEAAQRTIDEQDTELRDVRLSHRGARLWSCLLEHL